MPKKKRIIVVYATAGVGHKKAAFAIAEALKKASYNVEVELVDVLDYTSFIFRKGYCAIYLFLIKHLNFLWGFFYYFLNLKFVHSLLNPLRRASHVFNSARFIKFILEYRPDIMVSTHFLAPDVCFYLKKKYALDLHVINVITDYRAHSFWVSLGIDTYAVGHNSVKEEMIHKWGVSPDRVIVTGIPVEQKFCVEHDRISLREKMGIPEGLFTVLFLGGGYGVGPIVKILELLNTANFPLAAIAVCGHNKKLKTSLESFKREARITILNLGFVDNIDELIAVSDVCIGKAGGMSTSEAFAEGVPFIFVRPIPGQERANTDLFVKLGAGIELKKIDDILKIVTDLRSSPEKLETLRKNIAAVRKPHAAETIAEFAQNIRK